ncbi:MAG: inorganic phosphate transporter [Bacteroides sp.]|jgi:phosphate/sulfate permease|nr:inorganic phosphate transporter [Bacteroides sp.]
MDTIYIFLIIALFILAISDLVVGVGNDAVNFLNSAIGAKVAPFKWILAVAALGVMLGATFSGGMMEIARSGVFHPDQFVFDEIIIIFLAVMITDVILLDMFNTFGLPTSTTVSIIFELLGGAVAVSLYKMNVSPDAVQELGNYINSSRALTIIFGILLSVVIAFTFGTIIQFLSRLLFTFRFERNVRYFGALWGSLSITAIVYFLLVKGAKGASFMTPEVVDWIHEHTVLILASFFIGLAVLLQLLIHFFRINVFRIIVLVGTFSIAMAFAGNDLVNFIGVPLAGYDSLKVFLDNPEINSSTFTMEMLLEPVKTPTFFLLGAGVIMVLTLFFSKKARSVTQTEMDLARQHEGNERFPSSLFARTLVRKARDLGGLFERVLPDGFIRFLDRRFDNTHLKNPGKNAVEHAHFDQLRASVNMFVASSLIALATSLKLPLSTTYVTFMVAMGTSFADRSWGRESAVYRITGVMMVIGGWFFTAFTAFTVAFLLALLFSWAGLIAAGGALLVAFAFMIRTNFIHKKRLSAKTEEEKKTRRVWTEESVVAESSHNIGQTLRETGRLLNEMISSYVSEDRKRLKTIRKDIESINAFTKGLKKDVFLTLKKLEEGSVETGHYYVQVLDYLREIAHCLHFIVQPAYEHLENNHPTTCPELGEAINTLNSEIESFFYDVNHLIETGNFSDLKMLISNNQAIIQHLEEVKMLQIRMIKDDKSGTRSSLVTLNMLTETKNILLHTINVMKSHRDFLLK